MCRRGIPAGQARIFGSTDQSFGRVYSLSTPFRRSSAHGWYGSTSDGGSTRAVDFLTFGRKPPVKLVLVPLSVAGLYLARFDIGSMAVPTMPVASLNHRPWMSGWPSEVCAGHSWALG